MRFNFIGAPRLENFAAAATIFPICAVDQRRHEAELRSRQRNRSLEGFSKHHSYFSFYPNVSRERPEPIDLADCGSHHFQRENAITVSRVLILRKSCRRSGADKLKHLQSSLKINIILESGGQNMKRVHLSVELTNLGDTVSLTCAPIVFDAWPDCRPKYAQSTDCIYTNERTSSTLYRSIDASNSRRGIGKSTKRYAPVASNSFETVIASLIDSPVNRQRLYYSTRELESVSNCLQVAVSGIEIDSLRRP